MICEGRCAQECRRAKPVGAKNLLSMAICHNIGKAHKFAAAVLWAYSGDLAMPADNLVGMDRRTARISAISRSPPSSACKYAREGGLRNI